LKLKIWGLITYKCIKITYIIMSKFEFTPAAFFEVESIHPVDALPQNDSLTFCIQHLKRRQVELLPIKNIICFSLLNDHNAFEVKICKGSLAVFEGSFEITSLELLNKETDLIKTFLLNPIKNNKKLKSLNNIENIKIVIKAKIGYNSMQVQNIQNNKQTINSNKQIFDNTNPIEKIMNEKDTNISQEEKFLVSKNIIYDKEQAEFNSKIEDDLFICFT